MYTREGWGMFLALCRMCGWEYRSDEVGQIAIDHSLDKKHTVDVFSLPGESPVGWTYVTIQPALENVEMEREKL